MHKEWIPVVSIVLTLTCSAWAFVGQEQGFNIGAANSIMWSGGVGLVEGGHQAMVCQQQSVGGGWNAGFQAGGGLFRQTASAGGQGPASIGQTADIFGGQQQGTGTWGQPATSQGQQLGVNFTTSLDKPWGAGTANASQGFLGGQTQSLMSPNTMGTQSQFVGVREYANIVGAATLDPTVDNEITIGLNQNQQAVVPVVPYCRP
ncbi:MAG: hypothetical protein ABFE13_01315 [Phycisphaerales bacterium]